MWHEGWLIQENRLEMCDGVSGCRGQISSSIDHVANDDEETGVDLYTFCKAHPVPKT